MLDPQVVQWSMAISSKCYLQVAWIAQIPYFLEASRRPRLTFCPAAYSFAYTLVRQVHVPFARCPIELDWSLYDFRVTHIPMEVFAVGTPRHTSTNLPNAPLGTLMHLRSAT